MPDPSTTTTPAGGDTQTTAATGATAEPSQQTAAGATATTAAADPASGNPATAGAAKPAEPQAPVKQAPEAYSLTLPEGSQMDDAGLKAFSEIARKADLSNDSAQLFLSELAPVMAQRFQDQAAAIQQQWADAAKADKEFGGDKFGENLATAQKAIDKFGTPELTQFLIDTGLGKHPELIRAFVKVGRVVSEDSLVTGNGSQTTGKSVAERMFPNMNP